MHYFQFNIKDYKSHTAHLSPMEDLAYRRLLDLYYLHEKPIPSDCVNAARLIGLKDHFHDVELVLNEFFVLTDDGWINTRADKEISVYKGYSDAGKRGAEKRWSKGAYSPPIAPPIATNNHKPLTNNHKETKKQGSAFALPDWIDKDDWDLWIKTRKGKKMIPEQMQAQVNKLDDWRKSGIDYRQALKDAAAAGWSGLFEPKANAPNRGAYARIDVIDQIMGGTRHEHRRPIKDITPRTAIESDGKAVPEVDGFFREPDGS